MATVKLFNHHFRTPFIFLLLSEYVLLFLAVYVGVFFRFETTIWQPLSESLQFLPLKSSIFALVMVLSMLAMGQYQAPGPKGEHFFPYIFTRVAISLVLGTFALLVVYYAFPEMLIGRGVFGYAVTSAVVGLSIYRSLLYKMIDGRALRKKILVIGAGKLASSLIDLEVDLSKAKFESKRILTPKYASYVVHGFVHISDEKQMIPDKYLVNPEDDLVEYCQEYEIEEIVLAIDDRRKTMPVDDLLDCKLSNIGVSEFISFWEKEKGMLRLDMLNPSWLIFSDGCRQGDVSSFFTRIFDILVSLVILILMFPILVITAFLILIENGLKGPVFYRQKRVGLNGKVFQLLKFRSMIVNAEKAGEAQWATEKDNRITLIGRFIRKVRIDELPQILNIFKGDMSLVGPRPERPEFVSKLEEKISFFSTRHRVKPGLAGWAQLKYPYGASDDDAYKKLEYDLYYVKNHTILMDALILLQTVEVILLGKGAR